jgi:hypothetical protein
MLSVYIPQRDNTISGKKSDPWLGNDLDGINQSVYTMPCTTIVNTLSCVIPTITLSDRFYYSSHFLDKETEAAVK